MDENSRKGDISMGKRVIAVVLMIMVTTMCLCSFVSATGATTEPEGSATLVIRKVDAGTGLPVAGAEFVLSQEDGTYLVLSAEGATYQWVETQEQATVLVTDGDGLISLQGFIPGTYYLTETKAPNGYTRLTHPVKVCLGVDSASQGITVQVNDGEILPCTGDNEILAEVTVENIYGAALPDTGGIGTTIYYMLGMIAVFAVALTVVAKRLVPQEA